jgi:hypothetical protein
VVLEVVVPTWVLLREGRLVGLLTVVVDAVDAARRWGAGEVETETETDEEATDGVLEGFGFGLALVMERSEEKRLAGLDEPLVWLGEVLADGADAVAVAFVTEGAEGCAGLMEAAVRRIGAAEDGILMVLLDLPSRPYHSLPGSECRDSTQLETCISVD